MFRLGNLLIWGVRMPIQLSKVQPLSEWYDLVNQAMLIPVEASHEVHFAKSAVATTSDPELAGKAEESSESTEQADPNSLTAQLDTQAAQINPWLDHATSSDEQFAQALSFAPQSEKVDLAYASDHHETSSITSWFQDAFGAISNIGSSSKTWWTAAASAVSGLASESSFLDNFSSDSGDEPQSESETPSQAPLNAQDQNNPANGNPDNQSPGSEVNSDLSSAAQGLISALRPQATGLSDSSELGEQLALLESQLVGKNPVLTSTEAELGVSTQTDHNLHLIDAAKLVVEPITTVEVFGV